MIGQLYDYGIDIVDTRHDKLVNNILQWQQEIGIILRWKDISFAHTTLMLNVQLASKIMDSNTKLLHLHDKEVHGIDLWSCFPLHRVNDLIIVGAWHCLYIVCQCLVFLTVLGINRFVIGDFLWIMPQLMYFPVLLK